MNKTLLLLGSAVMLNGAITDAQAGHKKGRHRDHMRAHTHEEILRRLDGLERDGAAREELLHARIGQLQQELEELRFTEIEDVKKLWRTRPDARTWLPRQPVNEFTVGASYKNVDITGGELPLFGQGNVNALQQPPLGIVGNVQESRLTDEGMGEARLSYSFDDEMSIGVSYGALNTSGVYGFGGAGGAAVNDVFLPLVDPANGGATFVGAATATREVDIADWSIETENRVVARKRFALNMFGGVRGVDLNDRTTVFGDINAAAGGPIPTGVAIDRSSDFVGIGPKAGIRGRFAISRDLEIQGALGMSAVVGRHNFTHVESTTFNIAGNPVTDTVAQDRTEDGVVPVLDLGSKLVWHATRDIKLHAGYDLTSYMNASFDRRNTDAAPGSAGFSDDRHTVTLDGFTLGADFTF